MHKYDHFFKFDTTALLLATNGIAVILREKQRERLQAEVCGLMGFCIRD